MYGCDIKGQPEATRIIPFILGKISPYFSYECSRFKMQMSKESTLRISLFKELRVPAVYTMESTFCGTSKGPYANIHMTTENLCEMGK